MSEKKRLLVNTVFIAIGNMGAKIVSFLLLPLYTSILSTEEYGDYDYIVTIASFLLPIITLCLHEAMFRFLIDNDTEDGKREIISLTSVFIVVCCAVLAAACIILKFTINPKYIIYLLIYTVANVLYVYSNSILRGLGKTKLYAILSSGKNILQVVLNVLAVLVFGMGIEGLLISLIISEILAFIVNIFVSKLWRYISFENLNFKRAKELFKYSVPLIPNSISATLLTLSDRLMITWMIGSDANGIYAISCKFPSIIDTVYHFFYTSWSESSARVLKDEKEDLSKFYNTLLKQINNMVFACLAVMTVAMPILFRIFIKGDYVAGFDCVPFLMLGTYFNCIAKYYAGIFTAYKKTGVLLLSTMASAIINVALNFILLTQIGIIWAAITTCIANFIMFLLRFIFSQKYIKTKFDIRFCISAVLICVLIWFMYDYNSFIKMGISLAVTIVYSIIINYLLLKQIFHKTSYKIKKKKEQ